MSVCLSVCPQHNSKTNDPEVFKLGIRNDLGVPISGTNLGFKGQRSRSQARDASDRCWPISRERNTKIGGSYSPHWQQCLLVSRSKVKGQGHMVNNSTQ